MSADYRDPIIQKIIEVLEANGPDELRGKYYNGDVMLVPKEELPVCSVAKDRTIITPADNMTDQHTINLVINVLYDYTSDLQNSFDLVAGTTGLYEIMEGRISDLTDEKRYQFKNTALAYILGKKIQLDTNVWISIGQGSNISIEYGLGVNRRGPGIFSVEAVIRTPVVLHIPRPEYYDNAEA